MQQKFFPTKIQRKNILLFFTRELIRNSGGYFFTLNEIVKEKEHEKKNLKNSESLTDISKELRKKQEHIFAEEQMLKQTIREEIPVQENQDEFAVGIGAEGIAETLKSRMYEQSLNLLPEKKEKFLVPLRGAKLVVPETRLPEHFQYLKPTPSDERIDLGKLNPLIKDPRVREIECAGPDANVSVTGTMGNKNTGINLSRDEISEIIDRFSAASKIPVHEGVFKVVFGNMIFMAIVSEIVGSRFTIKKMIAEMPPRRQF